MKQLNEELLRVILLLIGLYIFDGLAPFITLILSDQSLMAFFLKHYYWIGKIIFGIVLLYMLKEHKTTAIPIGILGIMLPVYGGLFYLITKIAHYGRQV